MFYKIGLKIWSINTDFYLKEAEKLYENKVYDYIELYSVPNSLNTLKQWKKLKIPFIIHNPHFKHNFNLAKKELKENNLEIYKQTKEFADELNAKYIIFHSGMDGEAEETINQLLNFNEKRALIENKPFVPIKNSVDCKFCRGSTFEELKYILDNIKCGFCFDIGHAICSANYQKIKPYIFLKKLLELNPKMFHLSDLDDINTIYDCHLHLGEGKVDIKYLKKEIFSNDSIISIETNKDSKENLNDFVKDVEYLKKNENFV